MPIRISALYIQGQAFPGNKRPPINQVYDFIDVDGLVACAEVIEKAGEPLGGSYILCSVSVAGGGYDGPTELPCRLNYDPVRELWTNSSGDTGNFVPMLVKSHIRKILPDATIDWRF